MRVDGTVIGMESVAFFPYVFGLSARGREVYISANAFGLAQGEAQLSLPSYHYSFQEKYICWVCVW